jgi:hypothetical protein
MTGLKKKPKERRADSTTLCQATHGPISEPMRIVLKSDDLVFEALLSIMRDLNNFGSGKGEEVRVQSSRRVG